MGSRSVQIAALALLAASLAAGSVLRGALGLEFDPDSLRERVEAVGPLGPLLFIGAILLRPVLMIPSFLLLTVGGLCFGVLLGTLYGGLGLTLYGLVQWVLVQLAGADALRARVPARLEGALRAARSRVGAGTLALVAAYPFSLVTPVQLAAALAGMSLAAFAISVGVGSLLRAALFAWFGSALVEGERALLASALLTAVALAPLLHPRARRFVFASFGARRTSPGGDSGSR